MRPPSAFRSAFAALAALCAVLLVAVPARAQTAGQGAPPEAVRAVAPIDVETAPRPEARATRTDARITIDGLIDEAAWQSAEPITGFIQTVPATGMPATENTVVRVLYDAERLYISAICYESDMGGLIVPSLEQDFETHDSDMFGVTIDTYLDRRNAFMFLFNPGGAIKDGQVFDNSRNYNLPWEGVMDWKVAKSDSAWTVEMAIPFTTLRFAETDGEQSWGFQFSRRVRRKNEDTYWAPLARRELIHKMSRAGTLHGFQGMRPGRNLSVKPYMTASNASGSLKDSGAGDSGFDGGFDLKWGITPRLTADATFRTDFSQVEVDQERVNLTRFSLFFPEKRDFFLENAGTFTFGDVTERNVRMGSSLSDFTLFHSRRIGLDASGLPIPILGGGRLTGQAGAWNVGLLEMQTRSDRGYPAENFAVARVRRNVLGDSDVGAILVNRQATDGSGAYNRSYGVDANLHLLGNLLVNSYLAGTDDPAAAAGDRWAGRLALAWRDRLWDVSSFVKQVGAGFDPGVGLRAAQRHPRDVRHRGRAPGPGHPEGAGDQPVRRDVLHHRSGRAAADPEPVCWGSRWTSWTADPSRRPTPTASSAWTRASTPRSGATVPVGDYAFAEKRVKYQSSAGHHFSGSVSLTSGGYFNGDRTSWGFGALWRVNQHLAFDLFADRNEITLPDAAFTADVYGGRVNWALSTRFFTTAFVQYNAATDEVFSNVRLNYIHAPLSDLFLVYTERRDAGTGDVIDRLLSFKVTKLVGILSPAASQVDAKRRWSQCSTTTSIGSAIHSVTAPRHHQRSQAAHANPRAPDLRTVAEEPEGEDRAHARHQQRARPALGPARECPPRGTPSFERRPAADGESHGPAHHDEQERGGACRAKTAEVSEIHAVATHATINAGT